MALTAISGYAHIPAGTGYDNLNNWPSTTNRPSFSAGNNTLTWIGPLAGGPSTTGDAQQSLVLTNSGSITTSANNQVIQGLNIVGNIAVGHDNVTIKRCRIAITDSTGTAIGLTKASMTGVIIEDCLLDGAKQSYEGINCVSGSSFVSTNPSFVRRCTLTGFENHMTLWTDGTLNMTIIDNYFTAAGNSGNASYDGDMIELYGCDLVTIQHNVFDSNNSQLGSVLLNSAINLSNLGAVTNITINNNHINGPPTWPHAMINDDSRFGAAAMSWTFTNNGFINSGTNYRLTQGPNPSPNSGNYTATDVNANSGSALNGSGQI